MTDATAIPEPYQWDESFDVKVGSINDQHKKLFELIDALSKDQSNGDILNELLDTVKKHFQWEEVRRARRPRVWNCRAAMTAHALTQHFRTHRTPLPPLVPGVTRPTPRRSSSPSTDTHRPARTRRRTTSSLLTAAL